MKMRGPKVLVAKTSLDGHWRGVLAVSRALMDGGFEVVTLGMATADEIARAAEQEDVDLVGLHMGGRVEVVERVVAAVHAAQPGLPVMVGGTVPPWAVRRLEEQGIRCFPPGSALHDIVATARLLTERTHP